MSEGKVCVEAGKAAGTVVRKTNEGVEKVKGGTMTICKRVGNICGGEIKRLEKKKKKAVSRLGTEIWSLYGGKVFKSVFEQDAVKKLVREIEGYDRELDELRKKDEARKKAKARKAMIKKARTDLKSRSFDVRKAAIRVMDKLGDKSAIPYLNMVLDDKEKEIRESAAKVLHKLVNTVAHVPHDEGAKPDDREEEKPAAAPVEKVVKETEVKPKAPVKKKKK